MAALDQLREIVTVPHQAALPYRGDGVAHALREAYVTDDGHIPAEMAALLASIDGSRALIVPD